MAETENKPLYEYPALSRRKHKWDRDKAGFINQGELIGKCPSSMTCEKAQKLLDEAIPFPKDTASPDKEKIYYAVGDDGVVYVAYITNRQKPSYHGMPWKKRGNSGLSRSLYRALKKQAEEKGVCEKFDRWIRDHGK